MKNLKCISKIVVIFLTFSQMSFGQTSDEDQIKDLLHRAISLNEIKAWEAARVNDAGISSLYVTRNFADYGMGWDSLRLNMMNRIKQGIDEKYTGSEANYVIKQDGKLAFVEYDQTLFYPETKLRFQQHKYRFLMKENNQWKIFSTIVYEPESFTATTPFQIEDNLNETGYSLLRAKNTLEAIEIFKMNVKLFPKSWNTYDSLADGYEVAGEIKLAIQHYEKSIELNPKNENGKMKLVGLRAKK